ncbi:alpha/beta-hydrolase [Backusella circina FSU 941]|nr:alpha/beta-hydrolase [Backusella circina FSU 941]
MLKTIVKLSALLSAIYVAIIVILSIDTPQRCIMFLHWVRFPFNAKFDMPEYYGFGHNEVRNIKLKTSDNITIGAWHILPANYYEKHQLRHATAPNDAIYDEALADINYDTVIYFHGNALNRLAPWRVDLYKKLKYKFRNVNIITIDYRGFGDSESTPSEFGLRLDAQATLAWLNERKVESNRISLIGHSLGTGVATTLASDMAQSGNPAKALILKAGYSSMATLVFEYNIVPFFPILSPIKRFPQVENWLLSRLNHKFDSLSRIENINCPLLIVYGIGDLEIPITNSHQLFYRALYGSSKENTSQHVADFIANESNDVKRNTIPNEAVVYKALNQDIELHLVELTHGDHNNVGYFDYTYEAIRDITKWKII